VGPARAFKVVLCGDGGVGKTSIASVLAGAGFNPLQRLTVGVAHYVKDLQTGDGAVRLIVWDLGGEERFRFLAPVFLRGARGAVFVFDITREETFEHLEDWLDVTLSTVGDIPRVLVGNKADLEELRVVPRSYAELYAKRRGFLAYYEVSAKTGAGLEEPFRKLAEAIAGCERGG
jgi:small GTP-binding protein